MADPVATPTTTDKRSGRPLKKARNPTALAAYTNAVEALFAKQPDIQLPESRGPRTAADLAPPPEIVQNVQGSSAGAGSGEFHVYKASRRREYERLQLMEAEAKRKADGVEWERKRKELAEMDGRKTGRNQKRRAKARERREGKKGPEEDKKVEKAQAKEDGPDAVAAEKEEEVGVVIHEED